MVTILEVMCLGGECFDTPAVRRGEVLNLEHACD